MASPSSSRPTDSQIPGAPTKVTSLKAFQELLGNHDDVVVFCYKKYCPFCKQMAPVFDGVSRTPPSDGTVFVRVDLKEQQEIGVKYNITKYPTIVYFLRAREIVRFNGARKKGELEDNLRDAMNTARTNEPSAAPPPDGQYCQGMYEDRTSKPALFSDRKRPFNDLEPRCVIKPKTTELERQTQIARANEHKAHFAVYLWNKPLEVPGRVFFRLDFINDGPQQDRFESAMFQVTFGHDDADKTHLPINIIDIFPTSAEQLVSYTEFDADLGIDMGRDDASTSSEGKNTAFISGQGKYSSTATWNFVEADGQGINAHYLVWVTLPTTSKIWMKFYGKAVHIRGRALTLGRKRVIIQVGSLEKPYERILDLTEVI